MFVNKFFLLLMTNYIVCLEKGMNIAIGLYLVLVFLGIDTYVGLFIILLSSLVGGFLPIISISLSSSFCRAIVFPFIAFSSICIRGYSMDKGFATIYSPTVIQGLKIVAASRFAALSSRGGVVASSSPTSGVVNFVILVEDLVISSHVPFS